MRKILDDPRQSPALTLAIAAAEEIGCTVGKGYTLGNTEIGIDLTGPEPKRTQFIVSFRPENWRNGAKIVRAAARRHGIKLD